MPAARTFQFRLDSDGPRRIGRLPVRPRGHEHPNTRTAQWLAAHGWHYCFECRECPGEAIWIDPFDPARYEVLESNAVWRQLSRDRIATASAMVAVLFHLLNAILLQWLMLRVAFTRDASGRLKDVALLHGVAPLTGWRGPLRRLW